MWAGAPPAEGWGLVSTAAGPQAGTGKRSHCDPHACTLLTAAGQLPGCPSGANMRGDGTGQPTAHQHWRRKAAAGMAWLARVEPGVAPSPEQPTRPTPPHHMTLLPRLAAAPPALLPAAASILPVPVILPLPATGPAAAPAVAVVAATAIALPVAAAAAAAATPVAGARAAAATPAPPPLVPFLPPVPLWLHRGSLLSRSRALVCLLLLLLLHSQGGQAWSSVKCQWQQRALKVQALSERLCRSMAAMWMHASRHVR